MWKLKEISIKDHLGWHTSIQRVGEWSGWILEVTFNALIPQSSSLQERDSSAVWQLMQDEINISWRPTVVIGTCQHIWSSGSLFIPRSVAERSVSGSNGLIPVPHWQSLPCAFCYVLKAYCKLSLLPNLFHLWEIWWSAWAESETETREQRGAGRFLGCSGHLWVAIWKH